MQVVDLPLDAIAVPSWNPNEMTAEMRTHLRRSLERFGVMVPLVVRCIDPNGYETVGGAQRLSVMREMGLSTAPCVITEVGDGEAGLLSQALNHIAGADNAGLRGCLIRSVLETLPLDQVLAVLPETARSLQELSSLGQETIASCLASWDQSQKARLRHMILQLTPEQESLVQRAIRQAMPRAGRARTSSPNRRGAAISIICSEFLRRERQNDH